MVHKVYKGDIRNMVYQLENNHVKLAKQLKKLADIDWNDIEVLQRKRSRGNERSDLEDFDIREDLKYALGVLDRLKEASEAAHKNISTYLEESTVK